MNKVRLFLMSKQHKIMAVGSIVACMAVIMMSASAADVSAIASLDLATLMTDAVEKMVGDLFSMVSGVLPFLITLLGASVGITYAVTFIKKISSKT